MGLVLADTLSRCGLTSGISRRRASGYPARRGRPRAVHQGARRSGPPSEGTRRPSPSSAST